MSRTFRLGLVIVGGLLVLATGIFLIGDKEFLFSPTYTLKAQYQNVSGLMDGSDVRVGGVHEGTVKRIELPQRPDGKVTLVMEMHSATRSILKKDSVASIKSQGMLGDKYVEISFGSDNAGPLKDGDTIASATTMDISDLVQKADQLLDTSKGAMQNIAGTAENLKSVSGKINSGKGTVGALINDKTMYREATAGVTEFQEDMEAIKHNFFLRGFFRRRGYEDADELGKHAIARLPDEPSSKEVSYDTRQIFGKPDAAKLKNKKALNAAGEFLVDNPFGMAVVAVSAGVTGDTDKDRLLTEAQSMVVRDYLVQNFRVDDTRVKTLGMGKAKDPADGDKVKILLYPSGGTSRTVAQKMR